MMDTSTLIEPSKKRSRASLDNDVTDTNIKTMLIIPNEERSWESFEKDADVFRRLYTREKFEEIGNDDGTGKPYDTDDGSAGLCQICFLDMSAHDPTQLCGKTECLNSFTKYRRPKKIREKRSCYIKCNDKSKCMSCKDHIQTNIRYAGTRTLQECPKGSNRLSPKERLGGYHANNEIEYVIKWLQLPSGISYRIVETFHLRTRSNPNGYFDGDYILVMLLENHHTRELLKVQTYPSLENEINLWMIRDQGKNLYIKRHAHKDIDHDFELYYYLTYVLPCKKSIQHEMKKCECFDNNSNNT